MSLLLRLLLTALTAWQRPRCDLLGPVRKRFLVGPADLDVLLHVNNGVYLSMLDVARVDLLLRSGALGALRRFGFYPVVAAQTIRYRRSLRLFQAFEVETRVIGWDEKAFLIQHQFLREGVVLAEAVVRSRFLKRGGGKVSPREVLSALGRTDSPPALPTWVAAWNAENAG
jgi:acyl-CoA thioesterase FadM